MAATVILSVLATIAATQLAAYPQPQSEAAPPASSASSALTPAEPCPLPAALSPAQLRNLARTTTRPTPLPASTPAREPLRALATSIVSDGCDARTGTYAHIHLRQWTADTSTGRSHAEINAILVEEQRWRADDGSGRVINTRYPAAGNPTSNQTHPPGGLPAAVAGPLAADPGLFASQLNDIHPSAIIGPQAGLRAIVDINGWHTPDRAVRAAALAVLSETDGVEYHGPVTDRAGRAGVAVSVTSTDTATRDLLILDAHTGRTLAYELTMLRDPGQLGITAPTIADYVLYIAHTRTSQPGDRRAPVTTGAEINHMRTPPS